MYCCECNIGNQSPPWLRRRGGAPLWCNSALRLHLITVVMILKDFFKSNDLQRKVVVMTSEEYHYSNDSSTGLHYIDLNKQVDNTTRLFFTLGASKAYDADNSILPNLTVRFDEKYGWSVLKPEKAKASEAVSLW